LGTIYHTISYYLRLSSYTFDCLFSARVSDHLLLLLPLLILLAPLLAPALRFSTTFTFHVIWRSRTNLFGPGFRSSADPLEIHLLSLLFANWPFPVGGTQLQCAAPRIRIWDVCLWTRQRII